MRKQLSWRSRLSAGQRSIGALWLLVLFAVGAFGAQAYGACSGANVDVCFRPGSTSCDALLLGEIDRARSTILVQEYEFRSPAVASALSRASGRGVSVQVLLDARNAHQRSVLELVRAGVPVRLDQQVAAAHNKIVIVDGRVTVGGSYNVSWSAERLNAENMVIITDGCTAGLYAANFAARWAQAIPLSTPY